MESSRIFVRGLPPKFTDDDVRKHFGKFPITDVKYFPARHIGYVGYKSPQDASKAVSYFNKTFIRMSRINVEMAKPIADKELHISRRELKAQKNQPRSDDYYPPPRDNNLKRKRDEVEQDPKLKEYLEVMQPRSKTNVWANDDAQIEVTAPPVASPEDAVEIPAGESDDEYQVIPKKTKTAQPKPQIEEPVVIDIPMVDRTGEQELAVTEQATENAEDGTDAAQATLTDADWLRSRTNRVLDLVEDDEDESHLEAPPQPRPISQDVPHPKGDEAAEKTNNEQVEDAAPDLTEEDKIRETGRLYLRNLSYEVSQEDLQERFSKYGVLDEVHVPSKRTDGKGKGFAFVQFSDPENAVAAYQENDGTIFQGRLLHILSGKAKRNDELDEFAISKLPLKKQREVLRKKNAGAHSFNWNSLYLNTDAVISAVAQRLNISKAELLDHTSSDAAVKQAQAETHVIQETKNYFAQHGVDLEAFKKSSKGDLAILVKNIPHGVSAAEVKKLFEEHGDVKRFLYPPLGLTAIVELANATQAKTAFAALSYRKMKDSILYLEKAPKDLFKEGAVAPAIPTSSSDKIGAKLSAADLLEDEPKPDATNVATLHVKNLNFSTTTQKLTETFSPLAGFRSAVVRSKIDPKRGVLSLGYGFVEFNSAEAASAALRAMDGHNLEGHALKIQASHRGADAAEERRREDAAKKAPGTKILIKNLPFEATKKDIRALFAPYGALRSVRVPKKFDSSSRGFGFAEYSTQRDATNAMNALKNTHLLGRRLVLTFAETEGDDPEAELEKMQQKVGSQANKVALQRLTSGGRKKFNVTGTDDLDDA